LNHLIVIMKGGVHIAVIVGMPSKSFPRYPFLILMAKHASCDCRLSCANVEDKLSLRTRCPLPKER